MKKQVFACLALLIFSLQVHAQIVKGYFPYYRNATAVNNINYAKLTDIVYAFASLDGNGNLAIMGDINVFNTLKANCASNNKRLWIAIGGWGLSSNFPSVAASVSLRNNMATQCLNLCTTHGLAGIDIDWEFPSSGDAANFTALLAAVKGQLGTTYKLSAALGGESFNYLSCVSSQHASGVQAAAFTHLDFFNIMSYDAPSCFPNHTSLDFAERSMDGWNAKGCPYSKMLIGAAFYSRGAGEMFWSQIANTTRFNDADGIESGYTFDSKQTLIAKANMAICTKGAAGMMTWELSQDVAPSDPLNLTAAMYDAVQACSCPFSDPSLGVDRSLCGLGGQITLNPGIATNGSARTFTWKKNNTTVVNASTTQNTFLTTGAGTYDVIITEGTCTKTDQVVITDVLPTPALGTDKALCDPSYYNLAPSNAASFPVGTTWAWTRSSQNLGTTSNLDFVRVAGTYRLTASISGCASTFDEIVLTSTQPTPNDACIASAGVASLSISNFGAGPFNWFSNPTGGTSLATGTSFSPNISQTDTFWVQEGTGSTYYVGINGPTSGQNGPTDAMGLNFTVSTNTIRLKEVDVYIPAWSNVTNIFVKILNSAGSSTIHTGAAVSYNNGSSGSTYKLVVPVEANLAPGSYKLVVNSSGNLMLGSGSAFPYTNNDVSITSIFGSGAWPFAQNWRIEGSSTCKRLPVIAKIGGCSPTADISLSANAVNENVAANTTVGTLTTTGSGSPFTYTLVSGTGSTDNASFNISGNSLRITNSPNFEVKSSYSIRVRSTDQSSQIVEKEFIITITNVNETPTDISLSASSVNENVAVNTTVGTLSSTDPDASNTFTYTLVAGTGSTDNASFNISGSSLRIGIIPDFETKSSYSIRVRTTDQGGLTFEKVFTISINNMPENTAPTDISLSASSVNENVAANTTVGSLSTTDADLGNTFTYTLVAGTGSTDNASFNISGSSLRIGIIPDFETKSSYSIRVRTTDQGGLTFEKVFTININNLPENTAPTDISLSATSVNENVAVNTTVGTLSSTDGDAGNTFTYTLVAGTGNTDNASFNISGSSLRIGIVPDFETKSSYSIRVRTTDQGGLTFEKVFTISINNLPENTAPTDISLSASSVNENVAANTTVGSLSTTDADLGNTFTYTLVAGTGSTDNASFNISGSSLRIGIVPDFETKSSYSIRVRTTDQGGLTFEKVFTISINNVNESPTDISLSSNTVDENVVANTTVGTWSSSDVDAGNTFTYSLVTGTGDTDNSAFNISGSSLRITNSPDYETKSSYSIRVRTTDQGGLTFEKVFTISINDLNDVTSIADENDNVKFNVYPNPTQSILYVSEEMQAQVNIKDLSGKIIKEIALNGKSIDMSDLTSGTYILEIQQGNQILRKQIVKQ